MDNVYYFIFAISIFVTFIAKLINPTKNLLILLITKSLMVYGFSIIFVSLLSIGHLSYDSELPIVGENEIIRLKNGNILGIISNNNNRIQLYDKNLRFIKGFDLDVNGIFTINLLDENRVEVFGYKNRVKLIYDLDGRRLLREEMDKEYKPKNTEPHEKISFSTDTINNPMMSNSSFLAILCFILSIIINHFSDIWLDSRKEK
jgi:hypothetical protein